MAYVANYKGLNLDIDKGKVQLLVPYFMKAHKLKAAPQVFAESNDLRATINNIYANTLFTDSAKLAKALESNDAEALLNDP